MGFNSHLNDLSTDFLYHLGINVANPKNDAEIKQRFGDVRFVCMGGTKARLEECARHLREVLNIDKGTELIDLCAEAHRYAVFKVGPVLCCSHGIGMASMSILLHEIIKLLKYAGCQGPVLLRVGTCGGLGVAPGTVIVTRDAFNGYLRNEHEIPILGERVIRPAKFDENIVQALHSVAKQDDNFETIIANTMAADCFYEGQGRTDGASCDYAESDKEKFLERAFNEKGIRNIEMEATLFSSLTKKVGIKSGEVCVALVNRLNGDQINITMEQKNAFEKHPLIIVGRYIRKTLEQ